ncbi:MAG: VWA domain-containing protein, partial [Chloroflexi bacterium]|nr:VWA domain-containing protein [Chloroflexota bacterium]
MKAAGPLYHIVHGRQKGQVVVLMALAVVTLIGFTGLAIDVGIIMNARRELVRITDASALAAAGALSGDPSVDDATRQSRATARAQEYAKLHGFDPGAAGNSMSISFPTSSPARKLVLVQAQRQVDLAFMKVLGKDTATVSSGAREGEASPLDVVIVQDVSSSQCVNNYDTYASNGCQYIINPSNHSQLSASQHGYRADLATTNYTTNYPFPPISSTNPNVPWDPFFQEQDAARYFIDHLDPRYDQVALVSFSTRNSSDYDPYNNFGYATYNARIHYALTNNFSAVKDKIGYSPTTIGVSGIKGLFPSGKTDTAAGIQTGIQAVTGTGARDTAVGAVILLSDGVATARLDGTYPSGCDSSHPQYCAACRQDAMTQAQAAANDGIVIYTIFVGTNAV